VRDGKWKLTAVGAEEDWELYDMENDRTELENLAQVQPARVKKMAAQWEQWARRTNVLPWIWKPQYGEMAKQGGSQ
jgi:arylsulfatase A-like enzyme